MIQHTKYYRAIRDFAANCQPWQTAIRYQTLPDERWDLTLVSQRVYGNRNEYLAVLAAAGLDRFDNELTERLLILPTAVQLETIKTQTGYNEA